MLRCLAGAALGFCSGAFAVEAIFHNLFQSDSKETGERASSKLPFSYGLPESNREVYNYDNHVVLYNNAKKVPVWVAQRLTKDNLTGTASRENSQFQSDDRVPELFRSSNDDYWDSGWSRGHMAPASDNKQSQQAMNDTFYLTNIVPQDLANNDYFWSKLECYCRSLARDKYDIVDIVSGPLWLPSTGKKGKRSVTYDVIGKNDVAVPTHLFKVVVGENDGETVIGAFVVPNADVPDNKQPVDYQVPVESVEKLVGSKMFPRLDRSHARDLCEVDGCTYVYSREHELFLFKRRIDGAFSLDRLETVWNRVKKNHPTLAKELNDAYYKKLEQLKQE